MSARPPTAGAPRGMTLLEVMIASALASMLGMLTYGIISSTVQVQADALYMQNNFNAARVGVERMRRELTMAFVSLHQADDKRTKTAFVGESNRILFNTGAHEPLTRDSRTSDQLEVEYRLERVRSAADPDEYTQAVVRRVKYHIDDSPGSGGYDEVVVEGVKTFELEYFDKFLENWTNDWDVTIDDAVEMRVRLKELQSLRDTVEGVRDDEGTGVAGVVVADEAEQLIDDKELELLDGMVLPSRVRIKLELEDYDGYVFPMETQVEISMTEPLWY